MKASHDKGLHKNDTQYGNDGGNVQAAKINRYLFSDLVEHRISDVVDESDDVVVGIRVDPGEDGPGNDNPHEDAQRIVQHNGNCLKKISKDKH